jgi:hypothetical protein
VVGTRFRASVVARPHRYADRAGARFPTARPSSRVHTDSRIARERIPTGSVVARPHRFADRAGAHPYRASIVARPHRFADRAGARSLPGPSSRVHTDSRIARKRGPYRVRSSHVRTDSRIAPGARVPGPSLHVRTDSRIAPGARPSSHVHTQISLASLERQSTRSCKQYRQRGRPAINRLRVSSNPEASDRC